MSVQSHCVVLMVDDPAEIAKTDSPKGKPFLRLTFDNGITLDLTTTIAEMIGSCGTGLRLRWEDRNAAIGEPKGNA